MCSVECSFPPVALRDNVDKSRNKMVMVLWLDDGIGKSTLAKTLLMDPTKTSGIHKHEVPLARLS
jgi:ABC-type sugar transport system ATPase subunit